MRTPSIRQHTSAYVSIRQHTSAPKPPRLSETAKSSLPMRTRASVSYEGALKKEP
jgi:hypothetical protein